MSIQDVQSIILGLSLELFQQNDVQVSWDEGLLNLVDFSKYMIFECILWGQYKIAQRKSMRQHLREYGKATNPEAISAEAKAMQCSRTIVQLEDFREVDRRRLVQKYNIDPPELHKDYLWPFEDNNKGRSLTDSQFHEVQAWNDIDLLKSITFKRVCDNRHYTTSRFFDELSQYKQNLQKRFSAAQTSEEYVQAAIDLFNIEDRFCIEFFCALAVGVKERKIQNIPFERIKMLCGRNVLENGTKTDSRFVLERLQLIPYLLDEDQWNKKFHSLIYNFLSLKVMLFRCCTVEDVDLVTYFINNTKQNEWADFVSEQYPIQTLLQEKTMKQSDVTAFRKLVAGIITDASKNK